MEGIVVEVYKSYVKVHSQNGDKILKIKGKGLPEKGWILELKRSDPNAPFVGSVIIDSPIPLPSLKEAIPIVEATGTTDGYELDFLAELTSTVRRRLGYLPKWYYGMLGKYYKTGQPLKSQGVMSDAISKKLNAKKGKKDPLKAFGIWLNTFSHPLGFRSYQGEKRPTRIFIRKKRTETLIRIDSTTKNHGRIVIEGALSEMGGRLKVVSDVLIEEEAIKKLSENLKKILGNVLIVQGGKGLGGYV